MNKTKLCAFVAMAALNGEASAGSFSHLDRSGDAETHTHTGWSNDIYVKGFGVALGLLQAGAEADTGDASSAQPRPGSVDTEGLATGQDAPGGGHPPFDMLTAAAYAAARAAASDCAKTSASAPGH